jgi:UDP-N-acetylmuramoylalanine--D-glutamate ligase
VDAEYGFSGKRIVILGLARQGLALARFMVAAGAAVTISDVAPAEKLAGDLARLGDLPVQLALDGHPLALLDECDLLCLSGGVPPQIEIVRAAISRGIPLSNDSLLTLQLAKARGLGPTIAITGSSGKTTTTTLVGLMLGAGGATVYVGGNIGAPLIDRLGGIAADAALVLELSSFQLELFDPALAWGQPQAIGPQVGAILNVTPNHLDRHPNMAAYADAKFNLLRQLPPHASAVLSADDAVTTALLYGSEHPEWAGRLAAWNLVATVAEVRAAMTQAQVKLIPFSREQRCDQGAWLEGEMLLYQGQPICRRDEVKLRGDHNISNLLAAAAISGAGGASVTAMGEVARSFTGVPHRLEIVGEANGVTWINDSIATSPERAIAGLRSFGRNGGELILLAGGKDKNLPWDAFADEVLERVDYLIGFGQAGPMIIEKIQDHARYTSRRAPNSAVTQRLDEAVELASRAASPGTVVLLSPGGTSYDAYKDFEERGEHFRRLVQQIMAQSGQNCHE